MWGLWGGVGIRVLSYLGYEHCEPMYAHGMAAEWRLSARPRALPTLEASKRTSNRVDEANSPEDHGACCARQTAKW